MLYKINQVKKLHTSEPVYDSPFKSTVGGKENFSQEWSSEKM